MEPLRVVTGIVAPMDRANVDTDQIVPKQFLKRIERTGYGPAAFFDWRYLENGDPNPDFELNDPRLQGAKILVAGKNFGCGSSREHAPWALKEYGFLVIIAPSFADIFRNNCLQNGMLTITLPDEQVRAIMDRAKTNLGWRLTVDLENEVMYDDAGFRQPFAVEPFRKFRLLNGLDDIGLTLQHEDAITAYEQRRPRYLTLSAS
ncbi:MAG: 3-isopropylmalate dehydratase small subunit [Dehalococcoidia bacterium]|nr:3-isopropylmalate dehydratase small subunit [Dehalococcoidia bacterium]